MSRPIFMLPHVPLVTWSRTLRPSPIRDGDGPRLLAITSLGSATGKRARVTPFLCIMPGEASLEVGVYRSGRH